MDLKTLPQSFVYLFGDVVFKLKYRTSEEHEDQILQLLSLQATQDEITKITKYILTTLQNSNTLLPIHGNYIDVFPKLTPWSTGQSLQIFEGHHELVIYKMTIIFVLSPVVQQEHSRKRSLEYNSSFNSPAKKIKSDNFKLCDANNAAPPTSWWSILYRYINQVINAVKGLR